MENLIFQILFLTACITTYFYSAKLFLNSKLQTALLLLIVAGLALRLFTSCDFFLHIWDERYHALVAKNMIAHPFTPTLYETPLIPFDYKEWYNSKIFVHKQPMPLWVMAGSMSVFGINEIALRLPGILISSLAIYFTFLIGKYFYNEKVGFIAAFLHSVNGLIIELTAGRVATDHYDSYFLFFIELAILLSIKYIQTKKIIFNVLVGISIGLAILTKWLPALIVLPIWILIVKQSGYFTMKQILIQFIIIIGVCVMVFMPWQIYIENMWPAETAWEKEFNRMHITQVLDGQVGAWWYFLNRIRINYGELIYLPLIWFFYKYCKDHLDLKKLALLIWFIIPIIFFSFVKTKMQGYILFTAPALFIVTAAFIVYLSELQLQSYKKFAVRFLIFLILILPIRYGMERVKVFSDKDRSPEWVVSLKILDTSNIKNGVLFNYSRPIEAMFYTDLIVYAQMPDQKLVMELQNKGYTILINDNGKIPMELSSINGLIIKKFVDPETSNISSKGSK